MMGQNELMTILVINHLSAELSADELELLIKFNQIADFAAGTTIIQQGKESAHLYIVIDGEVMASARMLDGRDDRFELYKTGDFFGESSFVVNLPNAATVTAKVDTKCLMISKGYIDLLSEHFPVTKYKLYHAIARQVCTRIKKMHDRITQLIENTDMTTQSFFSGLINAVTTPNQITYESLQLSPTSMQEMAFFSLFREEELDLIIKHSMLVHCPKQCTLIGKEGSTTACCIVLQGAVQSSIVHDLKAAKLSVIGPQTLFASISCVLADPAIPITFLTCEKTNLMIFTYDTLRIFRESHPHIWYKLFFQICRSLVILEGSLNKLDVRLNTEIYNR